MKIKEGRYYQVEVVEGKEMLCVYDTPYTDHALSVSITGLSDMQYYRSTYNLSKVWGKTYK